MLVTCLKENLKESLDNALRIVKYNSTLPILNNFLLSAEKGRLKISATDLEIGFTAWVSSKVSKEGRITVGAQLLNQFINNLPNQNIELEVKDSKLHLNCGNIKASFNGLDAEDFPIIPKLKNALALTIDAKVLKDALASVVNSAALSDARPEISSVYVRMEPDQIKFVATDSFRLAHKTIFLNSEEMKGKSKIDFSKSENVIIPLRTAAEVLRLLGEKNGNVSITIDQNQVLFDFDGIHLVSRLIEGNYPDYEAIIPKGAETKCFFAKDGLEEAVKLAGCFSTKLNDITIKTNVAKSNLEVLASHSDYGSHHAKIESEIKGKDAVTVFNWRYVLDGLKNISGENAVFEINGDQKPAVLKPADKSDFFYILMPIKNN